MSPDPTPERGVPRGDDDVFVVQEHHARRLHWDLRLERHGVLASWALPKGVPDDPARNGLAVHTEDHGLEYATYQNDVPADRTASGRVRIWDAGTYTTETWTDREVKVVFDGQRVRGRYALFRTRGEDWMIHRMSPPEDPTAEPLPDLVRPMLATAGELPRDDGAWSYEMKWDGVRAITYVDRGALTVRSRSDRDVTATYPELRGLTAALGEHRTVLDGEVVALDEAGRPSFGVLQQRMHVQRPTPTLRAAVPVTYLVFDVLHLDGHPTTALPYAERRELLDRLALSGPSWQTPPHFAGSGELAVAASTAQGLEGVVAKKLTSVYRPGRRSSDWVKVKHERTQDVVVVGWHPGEGRRSDTVGALLLAVPEESRGRRTWRYAGQVGTGFSDAALRDLHERLRPLVRRDPPVEVPKLDAKHAVWVDPVLVGEVVHGEWTRDGRLRHPSWRGLRDRSPDELDPPTPA